MKANKITALFMAIIMIFSAMCVQSASADSASCDANATLSTELGFSGQNFDVIIAINAEYANGYAISFKCENCSPACLPVEIGEVKASAFEPDKNYWVAAGFSSDSVDLSGDIVKYTFTTDSDFTGNAGISFNVKVLDIEGQTMLDKTMSVSLKIVTPIIDVYAEMSDVSVTYPYTDGGYVYFNIKTPIVLQGLTLSNFVCNNPAVTIDIENAEYIGGGNLALSDAGKNGAAVFALDEMTEISGNVVRIPFTVEESSDFGNFYISCSAVYDRNIGILCDITSSSGTLTVNKLKDGDVNGDGIANSSDPVYLLWNIFYPEEYPIDFYRDCDFDGNGKVNISDAVYLLWHQFD